MNICDEIEEYLLAQLGDKPSVLISRNSLSRRFDCAPSQISYVLSTRFGLERGFITASRRGGGGYVEISRVELSSSEYPSFLLKEIGEEISAARAERVLAELESRGILGGGERKIASAAAGERACRPLSDKLRAAVLKNILMEIVREKKHS